MKLYALYFSPIGGTKKVLDIICSAWNCQKEYINLSDIPETNLSVPFNEDDICIVSVPSFSGRVPQFIIPILQTLNGNKAKAILIVDYAIKNALFMLFRKTITGNVIQTFAFPVCNALPFVRKSLAA